MRKLSALAAKWEKPYSQVCGYVNARMSIAIVRTTHLCLLRGSRIPTGRMSRHTQTVGAERRPQPFPPLRPVHVALALCFLAKTVQMHFPVYQSTMTRLPSRGWTLSTHLIRSTCLLNLPSLQRRLNHTTAMMKRLLLNLTTPSAI
jgi:hypothetical protein